MGVHKSQLSLLQRLLNKIIVDDVTDCWLWQGGKNNLGYGMIRDENKMRTSHRVSYEEHNQVKIPKGMCVCHRCDNPACINPNHLWLGTRGDNMQDMITKGRHKCWGGGKPGISKPKYSCTNCGTMMAANLINRYHNNNCKLPKI